jgi:hypothetical protein
VKAGDIVVCIKSTKVHTKYKSYTIIKVEYGVEHYIDMIMSLTKDFDNYKIMSYDIDSDSSFLARLKLDEFEECFITTQEYRKLKLQRLKKLNNE